MFVLLTAEMSCGGVEERTRKIPGGSASLGHSWTTVGEYMFFYQQNLFVYAYHNSQNSDLCPRVKMVESLSNVSIKAILDHIRQHFVTFIQTPRHKQTSLAEKAITVLVKENAG